MSENQNPKPSDAYKALDELVDEQKAIVAKAIGEVTLGWNKLQESLGLLFSAVLNARSEAMALDVWHSLRSDLAQRNMLTAAVESEPPDISDELSAAILWLTEKVDALSSRRNETVHTHFSLRVEGYDLWYEPDPHSKSKMAKRLAGKDAVAEFRGHSEWANRLSQYAIELRGHLPRPPFHHDTTPLPDKPRLPDKTPSKTRKK